MKQLKNINQRQDRIEKEIAEIIMKNKLIPKLKNEDKEREFWATHDSTDYIDWNNGKELILPKLKPSLKTISLRVPESLIDELKFHGNKKDIPYQSLLKIFLVERIEKELKSLSKI